jgi:amino-acid N-acetyltransferase
VIVALQPRIRGSRASDQATLLELLRAAHLPTADIKPAPGLRFWVLVAADQPVGVIGLERFGAGGVLRSLAVASTYQRLGGGRALVSRLESDARAAGIEQLVLLTETAPAFFAKLGYEVIDRSCVPDEIKQSAEFSSLCPASALCMTKSLR